MSVSEARLDLLLEGFEKLYEELTTMPRKGKHMLVSVRRLNQLIMFVADVRNTLDAVDNSSLSCDDIHRLPAERHHKQALLDRFECAP